jgi:hypothetical protein
MDAVRGRQAGKRRFYRLRAHHARTPRNEKDDKPARCRYDQFFRPADAT